jgi:N-acetylglucosamine-6-sulfatase
MLSPLRRCLVLLLLVLVAPAKAAAAPNVVVIETDDQTVADLAAMPKTRALIARRGVTYANSFVSLSECCPSRATFLTGQYAHNHHVRSIGRPWGGFWALDGSETLPVWLQRAGYATGVVGKYLNGYGRDNPYVIPPGWTDFEGLLSPSTYHFYGFTMNVNGVLTRDRGYQTDAITRRSVDFIRRRSGGPFFLWSTYVAPHVGRPRALFDPLAYGSTVPPLRFTDAFFGTQLPRPPSFNEADVSDKPAFLRNRPRLRPWQIRAITETHRQRLASLLAVDEGVTQIVQELRAARVLANTVLIFTSDNGWMAGEHRVPNGKILAYEPSIRVPLLMRGPGLPHGVTRGRLVWNGDLAPTILDLTGAHAAFPLDGRSLLAPPRPHRAILLEAPPAPKTNGLSRFTGIRTGRYKYVEHLWGSKELYDLRRDPDETTNLVRSARMAGVKARLARRLALLKGCAGSSCG